MRGADECIKQSNYFKGDQIHLFVLALTTELCSKHKVKSSEDNRGISGSQEGLYSIRKENPCNAGSTFMIHLFCSLNGGTKGH